MMDIQKEREAYLKMLVGNDAISNDQAETLKLMPEGSHFYTYGNQVSAAKLDLINWGWNSWVKAKSQAVPEGFVLIQKDLIQSIHQSCVNSLIAESMPVFKAVANTIIDELSPLVKAIQAEEQESANESK